MLALAMAARADEIDRASHGGAIAASQTATTKPAAGERFVASAVGVNGPDKIRTVFESHVTQTQAIRFACGC
jgi:hypothetical protein